jgi:hypothetical protein
MAQYARHLAAAGALAVLALAGASVASAHAHKSPWATTTATTTTTTSSTTATTTAPATTAAAGVVIYSPLTGTATVSYKGETLSAQVNDAASTLGATCTVDWGDGTGGTYTAYAVASGAYRCSIVHAWTSSGFYTISVTGTDENGTVGTSSTWLYVF